MFFARKEIKHLALLVVMSAIQLHSLKPSAQSTIFSSLRTKIFVAGDENLLFAGNTYKRLLSLTTIFNIKYARNLFSSLTTEDKISVASDKNRAVCARH